MQGKGAEGNRGGTSEKKKKRDPVKLSANIRTAGGLG